MAYACEPGDFKDCSTPLTPPPSAESGKPISPLDFGKFGGKVEQFGGAMKVFLMQKRLSLSSPMGN